MLQLAYYYGHAVWVMVMAVAMCVTTGNDTRDSATVVRLSYVVPSIVSAVADERGNWRYNWVFTLPAAHSSIKISGWTQEPGY